MKPMSAFERVQIGDKTVIGNKEYQLSQKFQISKHTCPYCHKKNTFHMARMKELEEQFLRSGKVYENVFKSGTVSGGNTRMLLKYDLCMECGRDWVFEIFCWEMTWPASELILYDFETAECYKLNTERKVIRK